MQITDADRGATVTATITFSEAMDPSSTPVIANNAGSTLTNPTNGHWVDATHYAVDYTVADANVTLAGVTFDVSGPRTSQQATRRSRPPASPPAPRSTRRTRP